MFDLEPAPQLSDEEIEALTATEFVAWDEVASWRQSGR
jgi:hypothetical protein